jgi:hypothetical protein
VRHATREGAWIAVRRTGQGTHEGLGVYLCKHCRGWHIGHAKGTPRFLIKNHLNAALLSGAHA